jgi:ABC-type polysaccharide/polyol phosphate transport system ATPase subunit
MIKVENVTLDFPALPYKTGGHGPQGSPGQATGGVMSVDHQGRMHVRALEDISFTLGPGDRLALLGHNGAGKTTLLRVMAGIYPPTQGQIHTDGRLVPLLNLSFGLDMEATGLDNIWVRGLFLGMSRVEIKSKIDAIAAFSELGEFLHLPMRTYSSGMRARLAFAVSTHVDADILLLDEVVATGDASFIHKARQQLEDIAGQSKILVLASHSNKVLRELCTKGLLLEHGKVKAFGPVDEVINTYKGSLRRSVIAPPAAKHDEKTSSSQPIVSKPITTRILLINDTGALPNPGCRAVRKGYKLLFREHIANTSIIGSVPVNYWIEPFREIAVPGKQAIHREPGMFPVGSKMAKEIDLVEWERTRQSLALSDMDLSAKLAMCDVLIVNGEGSMHHNSVRALALLALMKTALEAGRKVILLNATLQAVMPALLQDVFKGLALIHVREPRSHAFLSELGISSLTAPDIAFLAMDDETVSQTRLLDAKSHVLVTAGVTADQETLEQLFTAVENTGMRPVYLSIGDGGESELASRICSERNMPLVNAGDFGVKEVIGFVRQFPLAISGRHHINVFLMRAGVPFVPLPSNTWKVQETLRMVGYPVTPVSSYAELVPMICHARMNSESLGLAAHQAYESGKKAMKPLIDELKKCVS